MQFSGKLYPYQSEILEVFEKERARGDKKVHIVAPPGSGKTIIWLEMMIRLDSPTLILVPNLTLQEQWKDKLEKLFLQEDESSDILISTDITNIKKINIVTYQSLSGSDSPDDAVHNKILEIWFDSEKSEFDSLESFVLFVNELKENNPEEYKELYSKHRKKLKESGDSEFTRKLMKGSIHEYVSKLRSSGIRMMIVDEAHHLTSWWSHVLYEIWEDLDEPMIIGLTATPPFESVDYFELDESYTRLLGNVDYYVPTPAIVKSGRLAPYSDLVYVVPPDSRLDSILQEKEKLLQDFIALHKDEICWFLHTFLTENFARLELKSLDLLEKWMRFIYVYKGPSIDMSSYITGNASQPLVLEDIAKSIGKWWADGFKKTKSSKILSEIKSLFFDLGYIWRWANLYRFQTPIEKWLIYSKSKILGVNTILTEEKKNLGNTLRWAIITDFLDVDSDWINAHSIFDEMVVSHGDLCPYIVSGQGIWALENGIKTLCINETILSVTEKLTRWETRLVIGTRWILGEWWDCPALNTLIDLTGVSAYMSVNQVHGRAIRLDTANPEKVANIYDIVCIGSGFQGMRDFERLKKKHAQFYGVDDSGLIIKELDHIYPQLERIINNTLKINTYTLKKSALRSMVKTLWNIGGDYKNEEVFSLSIEVLIPYEVIPIPSKISWWNSLKIKPERWKSENMMELGKSSYHLLVRSWIQEILDATIQVMKPYGMLPRDFSYVMNWSPTWSITITSEYPDTLISKKFLEIVSSFFSTITNEKYLVRQNKDDTLHTKKGMSIGEFIALFIIGNFIVFYTALIWWDNIFPGIFMTYWSVILLFPLQIFLNLLVLLYQRTFWNYSEKVRKMIWDKYVPISFGIPESISSNEEKRDIFLKWKFNKLTTPANWWIIVDKMLRRNPFHVMEISDNYTKIIEEKVHWSISYICIFVVRAISIFLLLFLIPICIILFIIWIIPSLIHSCYLVFAKMSNLLKESKMVKIEWKIEKTSQDDIGKSSFLSAKIEKLWI